VITTVLLPAYNEAKALPEVLMNVLGVIDNTYEILVVDDGSSDDTADIARAAGCRVIRHDKNMGKGAAVRTGVSNARGRYIVVMDADATYPADAIPLTVNLLADHDFVRCIRSSGTEHIPLFNRLGNWVFDMLLFGIHRLEGKDHLSGLYGVRSEAIRTFGIESDGFDIEVELGVKVRAYGLSIATLPIGYHPRIGEKKLRPVHDGLRILSRLMNMALIANPRLVFIHPGILVWAVSGILLVLLASGPISTPFIGLHTTAFLASALGMVIGFQMIVFGIAAGLYATTVGMRSEPWLAIVSTPLVRRASAVIGAGLATIGFAWSVAIAGVWVLSGTGPFGQSQEFILGAVIMLMGIHLTMASLFVSALSHKKRDLVHA
jgi:hypothetical protein